MSTNKIAGINTEEYDVIYDEEGNLVNDEQIADDDKDTQLSSSQEDDDVTDDGLEDELPNKFKGKSVDDITKAYEELEKEKSRLANEVGDLRKLTKQILERDFGNTPTSKSDEIEEELDYEDDPQTFVQKQVEKAVKPLQDQLALARQQSEFDKFKKAHPDYLDVGQSPEFAQYVTASQYRINLYNKAQQQDYDAAAELLGAYKELKSALSKANQEDAAADKAQRKSRIRKASPESGATGASSGKIYKSADLIRMQINDPERYAQEQDAIMAAYREGRVK